MPRKPTQANEDALNLLRQLIRIKSNLNCSSYADIQLLHEQVLKSTGTYLSVQTLSRMLGIVHSNFKASIHTLDTLARFVNYKSFSDFEDLQESEGGIRSEKTTFVTTFFNSLFSDINPSDVNTSFNIIQNVVKWMDSQPQFNSEIYMALSGTAYGRRHFFQEFVNVDSLNKGFGKGLKYYLLHTEDRQEKLLGFSLNCFRHFLNNDPDKFWNYFGHIQQYRQDEIVHFHPAIIDRYHASLVLAQALIDKTAGGPGREVQEMISHAGIYLAKVNCCYFVGEALLLTGQFAKAFEMFDGCDANELHFLNESKANFALQLKVFWLVSAFYSGAINAKRAATMLEKLSEVKLPLIQTDYMHLFLLSLQVSLADKAKTKKIAADSFDHLVVKTQFNYFRTYLGLATQGEKEQALKAAIPRSVINNNLLHLVPAGWLLLIA